jgi:sugar phosphate isomerase/epimerase
VSDIKLGCYTSPWGPAGLIQAITEIGEFGFDGIECPAGIVLRYEDRLHVFQEILETTDLKLSGLLQGINLLDHEQADEQVERAVNAARFISAAGKGLLTICHQGAVPENVTEDDWATLGAIIEEIAARSAEFGITLSFMPRAQSLVGTEKEIARLMAMTGPDQVKLTIDTAEIALAGGNPQRVVKNNIERLSSVRFREVSGSKRRAKSTSNRPGTTPKFGRGAINFEAISKTLIKDGYSGYVIVDVSGENHQPIDAISAAYRYVMRKSGLFHPV